MPVASARSQPARRSPRSSGSCTGQLTKFSLAVETGFSVDDILPRSGRGGVAEILAGVDEKGGVEVDPDTEAARVPGLFAAGDVRAGQESSGGLDPVLLDRDLQRNRWL